LVEQYTAEIQQTKIEQREGFREFVMDQDKGTVEFNEEEKNEEEKKGVKEDEFSSGIPPPIASKKSYEAMVNHGLPALFSSKKTDLNDNTVNNIKSNTHDHLSIK
jgi:hypothetical protein